MKPKTIIILFAIAAAFLLSGCGSTRSVEVIEGEPPYVYPVGDK